MDHWDVHLGAGPAGFCTGFISGADPADLVACLAVLSCPPLNCFADPIFDSVMWAGPLRPTHALFGIKLD